MSGDPKLKPCPFCGGTDIRHHATLTYEIGRRVKCMSCHAEGPPARWDLKGDNARDTERRRRNAAFEAWNRRAIPEGYVLVPIEPTDDMLHAAQERLCEIRNVTSFDDGEQASLYRAMLSAVPQDQGGVPTPRPAPNHLLACKKYSEHGGECDCGADGAQDQGGENVG